MSQISFDLKPGNILLGPNRVPKIGLTANHRYTNLKDSVLAATILVYTAPERLQSPAEYNTEIADVYSFGILMWAVLSRTKPYESTVTKGKTERSNLVSLQFSSMLVCAYGFLTYFGCATFFC
jgi:serine/threonine protein kinase